MREICHEEWVVRPEQQGYAGVSIKALEWVSLGANSETPLLPLHSCAS